MANKNYQQKEEAIFFDKMAKEFGEIWGDTLPCWN